MGENMLTVKRAFQTATRRFAEGAEVAPADVGSPDAVAALVDGGYLAAPPAPAKAPKPVSYSPIPSKPTEEV